MAHKKTMVQSSGVHWIWEPPLWGAFFSSAAWEGAMTAWRGAGEGAGRAEAQSWGATPRNCPVGQKAIRLTERPPLFLFVCLFLNK